MIWFCNWFVKVTAWLLHVFAFRKKIYYEDKKVQKRGIRGKAIVVSNHYSIWDYPLLMFVFHRRSLRCQIAEVMYRKNFVLTGLLKGLGGVKVDRETHDFSFMEKSNKILKKKGVLLIFPESRLPREGEETPLPFKPSAVYTALENDAPIVPVAVNGSYFGKKRASVMIGKPIDVKEWCDPNLSDSENVALVNEKLREKVIALKDELGRREKAQKGKKEKEKM
ncbi:MAG: 1-acyl-sn-glycerol-3-phosphate acyltransferase [Clostridiales bacterium]|nr:1-acyl-sn-glycerol-3-phosphate acyltransferase [Clostridiales bacterium]